MSCDGDASGGTCTIVDRARTRQPDRPAAERSEDGGPGKHAEFVKGRAQRGRLGGSASSFGNRVRKRSGSEFRVLEDHGVAVSVCPCAARGAEANRGQAWRGRSRARGNG